MNTIDIFCAYGLPYVSPRYNGDPNTILRRKIKNFFSNIGNVTNIYINKDYVSVKLNKINTKGTKFKEMIDKSVTNTINVSWEYFPYFEKRNHES